MDFDYILSLSQTPLYDVVKRELLPDVVEDPKISGLRDMVMDKIINDNKKKQYTEILIWCIAYSKFKEKRKSHHKATRNRFEHAKELATWFSASWRNDPYDKENVVEWLAFASNDVRLRAALILYRTTTGSVPKILNFAFPMQPTNKGELL